MNMTSHEKPSVKTGAFIFITTFIILTSCCREARKAEGTYLNEAYNENPVVTIEKTDKDSVEFSFKVGYQTALLKAGCNGDKMLIRSETVGPYGRSGSRRIYGGSLCIKEDSLIIEIESEGFCDPRFWSIESTPGYPYTPCETVKTVDIYRYLKVE